MQTSHFRRCGICLWSCPARSARPAAKACQGPDKFLLSSFKVHLNQGHPVLITYVPGIEGSARPQKGKNPQRMVTAVGIMRPLFPHRHELKDPAPISQLQSRRTPVPAFVEGMFIRRQLLFPVVSSQQMQTLLQGGFLHRHRTEIMPLDPCLHHCPSLVPPSRCPARKKMPWGSVHEACQLPRKTPPCYRSPPRHPAITITW